MFVRTKVNSDTLMAGIYKSNLMFNTVIWIVLFKA
jgi:hypothetical protein